jgi:hypothetical protein
MKPLLFIQGLLLTLLLNLIVMARVCGQQINFSDSLGLYENSRFGTIVGKISNNYLVIEAVPYRIPQYFLLDTLCRLVQQNSLSFIPPGGFIKASILNESASFNILWQSLNGGYWYLHNTCLSGTDNKISQSKVIDSSILPLSVKYRPYFTSESGDRLHELLFRRIPDFENNQLQIDLITVEMTTGKVNKGQLLVPYNKEFDITSDLSIDNNGNVFTVVYDHPLNFRLSSGIRLYQFSPNTGQINYPEIFSKERKPASIFLQPDELSGRLVLISLYTDFYTRNINGIVGAIVNERTLLTDSLFSYSFPKDVKKQINKHITGIHYDKLMNLLELKDCRYNSDSGVSVLLELSRQAYNSSFNNNTFNRSIAQVNSANSNNPLQDIYNTARINRRSAGGRNPYNNYTPFNSSVAQRDQIESIMPFYPAEIPIQHIALVASFDGHFRVTNKKIIENRLTSEINYMPPFTFLKNGKLHQFVYDYKHSKPKLKQIQAGLLTDSLSQSEGWPVTRHWIILNHPALYTDDNFILSFYYNHLNNRYGLARLGWQE